MRPVMPRLDRGIQTRGAGLWIARSGRAMTEESGPAYFRSSASIAFRTLSGGATLFRVSMS